MVVTALKAIGLMAVPDTPPYVVRLPAPTAGQGVPSAFNPMRPETVLVAVTPSAPPSLAALAMLTISVTFGVNLAKRESEQLA